MGHYFSDAVYCDSTHSDKQVLKSSNEQIEEVKDLGFSHYLETP